MNGTIRIDFLIRTCKQWLYKASVEISSGKLIFTLVILDSNPGCTVFPIEGQSDLPRLVTFDEFLEFLA